MATIRAVVAKGAPVGMSSCPPDVQLALKLASPTDPLAKEALVREAEIFEVLCRMSGSAPCPRFYDSIPDTARAGDKSGGVSALVMEWCPSDLERWWAESFRQPRAFVLLAEALADICRRIREYAAILEMDLGKKAIHADIKPRNILRAADGRWLLTDFGAAKSRPMEEESWAATRMILGTENFIAPESLFNARKPLPTASDTWSIGCTFFALLRMRVFLGSGAALPINGTHSHHFRSHRVALVADMQERRPTLFLDKELDPSVFTSPDRLPDRDRQSVQEALAGVFGAANPALERMIASDCLRLLDRALSVDPALRYVDPLEMASDFEGLAERFREMEAKFRQSGEGAHAVPAPVAPAPAPVPVSAPRPSSPTAIPPAEPLLPRPPDPASLSGRMTPPPPMPAGSGYATATDQTMRLSAAEASAASSAVVREPAKEPIKEPVKEPVREPTKEPRNSRGGDTLISEPRAGTDGERAGRTSGAPERKPERPPALPSSPAASPAPQAGTPWWVGAAIGFLLVLQVVQLLWLVGLTFFVLSWA